MMKMLRILNLMTVWLIRLEGEKRSRSLTVLAANSSSIVAVVFLLSSSSASFEMPLNGLPRSIERNELWEKIFWTPQQSP